MAVKIQSITVCMGSSCFSRGNKKTVGFLQSYIKDRKLEDTVVLKGAHCMGNCDSGPVVTIDGTPLFHTDVQQLEVLLDKMLGFSDVTPGK